jgi:hypothetical protein
LNLRGVPFGEVLAFKTSRRFVSRNCKPLDVFYTQYYFTTGKILEPGWQPRALARAELLSFEHFEREFLGQLRLLNLAARNEAALWRISPLCRTP